MSLRELDSEYRIRHKRPAVIALGWDDDDDYGGNHDGDSDVATRDQPGFFEAVVLTLMVASAPAAAAGVTIFHAPAGRTASLISAQQRFLSRCSGLKRLVYFGARYTDDNRADKLQLLAALAGAGAPLETPHSQAPGRRPGWQSLRSRCDRCTSDTLMCTATTCSPSPTPSRLRQPSESGISFACSTERGPAHPASFFACSRRRSPKSRLRARVCCRCTSAAAHCFSGWTFTQISTVHGGTGLPEQMSKGWRSYCRGARSSGLASLPTWRRGRVPPQGPGQGRGTAIQFWIWRRWSGRTRTFTASFAAGRTWFSSCEGLKE